MDTKRWPILAQVLIGLGVVGGLMNIGGGLAQKNFIGAIFGLIGLVIYWNVYKFMRWALTGLNILLAFNIIFSLFGFFLLKGTMLIFCSITFIYSSLVLIYFNSKKIKGLFCSPEISTNSQPEEKI